MLTRWRKVMPNTFRMKVNLEFNNTTDRGFISKCTTLADNRMLSKYVTRAFKYVLSHPELYKELFGSNVEAVDTTYKKYKEIDSRLANIEKALRELEEYIFELKSFIVLRKMLAIEQKVDNALSAELLIKRQIKEINKILSRVGTDLIIDSKYIQDDVFKQNEKAEKLVEFTINYYDGIVNELRNMVTIPVQTIPVENVNSNNTEENKEETAEQVNVPVDIKDESKESSDKASELTDENLSLLENFFGGM